jgi:hypothetical protein
MKDEDETIGQVSVFAGHPRRLPEATAPRPTARKDKHVIALGNSYRMALVLHWRVRRAGRNQGPATGPP